MSSPRFEAFLARLYADEHFSARFLATPEQVLDEAGLAPDERRAALAIDPLELQMVCQSFAAKRAMRRPSGLPRLLRRLFR